MSPADCPSSRTLRCEMVSESPSSPVMSSTSGGLGIHPGFLLPFHPNVRATTFAKNVLDHCGPVKQNDEAQERTANAAESTTKKSCRYDIAGTYSLMLIITRD